MTELNCYKGEVTSIKLSDKEIEVLFSGASVDVEKTKLLKDRCHGYTEGGVSFFSMVTSGSYYPEFSREVFFIPTSPVLQKICSMYVFPTDRIGIGNTYMQAKINEEVTYIKFTSKWGRTSASLIIGTRELNEILTKNLKDERID